MNMNKREMKDAQAAIDWAAILGDGDDLTPKGKAELAALLKRLVAVMTKR